MKGGDRATLEPVDADGLPAFLEAFDATFGWATTEERIDQVRRFAEVERLIAARTPDQAVVGTAGAFSFDLALPGAPPAGCAGITVVSVRADHRRRGLLRTMMGRLLDDAAERGEPFAALWASESPIYGRFGFGAAAPTIALELDRVHAGLEQDGPVADVALVDADEAATVLPGLYEDARRQRHGLLSRSDAWWRGRELADPVGGGAPKRFAVLPGRGYAVYRLQPAWTAGVPDGTVEVHDLLATDPDATAALWRFVIETDLAVRLRAARRPVDDPLLVMLRDPGRARVGHDMPLYLRLVDVAAALAARGYAVDDALTIAVHDDFRPTNTGTWHVVVRDGRARCERTTAAPELTVDAEDLAAVLLGGVRPTMLAAAGRIEAARPDAVARLGRLLATEVAPWHGGMF